MRNMMEILQVVDGLFITPVSDGADRQNAILCEELPFRIITYRSGMTHNGWIVPQEWEVLRAEIRKEGTVIYNGTSHPLGVVGYSSSFHGRVSLQELKEHLFYNKDAPDSIVYHCDFYYKPHRTTWGFSVPYNLYKSLEEGYYDVVLETVYTNGTMKVLEYTHRGHNDRTIVLNAHNCHAAQLNDGPSGYVVGIEVMRRLAQMLPTKYTYKLIIAPEHIGSVFYCAEFEQEIMRRYKFCIFLEMLGNDYPNFSLQHTFSGDTELDRAASHYLKFANPEFYEDGFRKIVGNDETVWEAPGIEVPTITLSRCKAPEFLYPEYHLQTDNLSIMNEARLHEAVEAVLGIIRILETNCFLARKFTGLIALSNPIYDLYVKTDDPSINVSVSAKQKKWKLLMDYLPRYFNNNISILDIAITHDIPYHELYQYLIGFHSKGLVDFKEKSNGAL